MWWERWEIGWGWGEGKRGERLRLLGVGREVEVGTG